MERHRVGFDHARFLHDPKRRPIFGKAESGNRSHIKSREPIMQQSTNRFGRVAPVPVGAVQKIGNVRLRRVFVGSDQTAVSDNRSRIFQSNYELAGRLARRLRDW